MSDQNPLGDEGDPPIIIQGSSVNISVPPNFTEQLEGGGSEQAGSGRQKEFKNSAVTLVSLQIDDDPPITLKKNSKITIIYK